MITLGGVTLNPNLYLGGRTQSKQILYKRELTVEGVPILQSTPIQQTGRVLTLETFSSDGGIQGIWTQAEIDAVKALELANNPVTFVYDTYTFTVKIVDTTGFTQLFRFQAISPGKQYTGKLITIEV